MSKLLRVTFVQLIVYLWWTSVSVLNQELNNYQNIGTNGGNIGSSYFFYQHPGYPRDCTDASNRCSSNNASGVYLIKPDGYLEPFEVYCDNTLDSGGWTIIHRLHDGSVSFNRNWTEYKTGFGFPSQEFWLGFDKLSFLTNQKSYELRIDVTSIDGLSFYVTYNKFRISDEYGEYKLTSVGEYHGREDNINALYCPPSSEGVVYTPPDCLQRWYCSNGQLVCDNTYRCSTNAVCKKKKNNVFQCYCNEGYTGNGVNCTIDTVPSDCKDIYDRVSTESGVYRIKPTTWQGDPFDVYCNMSDGGGWTVFQRRVDGSQDFHLYWSDYKNGFGTPNHELWLGNDKLHSLTTQKTYRFRIDLVNGLGDPYYAIYSSFRIEDENDNYRLRLGSYSGDAGTALSSNNGQPFTTRDRDNDDWGNNCATDNSGSCGSCSLTGGWWHRCTVATNYLHGYYGECVVLYNLPGSNCNIRYTEMKIQPI